MSRRFFFALLTAALLSVAATATLSAAGTTQPANPVPETGEVSLSEAVSPFGYDEVGPLALYHAGTQPDSASPTALGGQRITLNDPGSMTTTISCWMNGPQYGWVCIICLAFHGPDGELWWENCYVKVLDTVM